MWAINVLNSYPEGSNLVEQARTEYSAHCPGDSGFISRFQHRLARAAESAGVQEASFGGHNLWGIASLAISEDSGGSLEVTSTLHEQSERLHRLGEDVFWVPTRPRSYVLLRRDPAGEVHEVVLMRPDGHTVFPRR